MKKNAEHILYNCGNIDSVNIKKRTKQMKKNDGMKAATMVGEVRSRNQCCKWLKK